MNPDVLIDDETYHRDLTKHTDNSDRPDSAWQEDWEKIWHIKTEICHHESIKKSHNQWMKSPKQKE